MICLPRNLSYVGESYLDRFSVSSAFVHNPKIEKQLLQADVEEQYLISGATHCAEVLQIEKEEQGHNQQQLQLKNDQTMADDTTLRDETLMSRTMCGHGRGPDACDVSATATVTIGASRPSTEYARPPPSPSLSIPASFRPYLKVDTKGDCDLDGVTVDGCREKDSTCVVESPDSDLMSEEGIFVNMMDDLDGDGADSANCKSTASEASDDTCVSGDSMYYSPDDLGSLEDEEARAERQQNLEEAVQHAASSLPPDPPESGTDSDLQLTTKVSDMKITLNDIPFSKEERQRSLLDLISPDSPVYEDREFNFTKAELRKSASLKSSKTPPGTPRRKKVVRFADAMGLDLESVRHILNLESPPKIPASAMKDLLPGLGQERKEIGTKYLTPCFEQPGCEGTFIQRVLGEKVSLENAIAVTGTNITGVVRVANISFLKNVRVRFTTNGWTTFHDIAASYVQNSNDGPTDRFSFSLVAPADFVPGSKLEFAVNFCANGTEYWDNNRGKNYVFECFARIIPTEAENSWMHFL